MAAPRNNTTSQALYKNFIGGKWADADRTGEVINPCTETVIERVPLGTSSDLQQAIEAAHNAFSGWKSANAWQRSDLLRKVATLMREGAADLAAVTVAEAGKPLAEATGEWLVAAQFFDWYAEEENAPVAIRCWPIATISA